MRDDNNNSIISLPVRLVPWAGLLLVLVAIVLAVTGGPSATVGYMLFVAATMLDVRVEPPAL